MPFEKGDFILIDYVGRVIETGEVFETTIEEVARKEGTYKEGAIYEPRLVVIGEGWVLKALDESLVGLELEKTTTIEIPPEKAFGNRDPDKVKLYPIRRLTAQGITPRIGMRVQINGRLATVRTTGSGRVQLDFNPPLAGKTLAYEVTVRKKLKTAKEKIQALIHRRIPLVEIDKFAVKKGKNTLTINIPEDAFYIEGLQLSKRGIFMDVQRFFPEIRTVKFVETFKRPEPAAEEPSPKEAPEGTEGSQ
ncbi:MAG: FKBP-type peptidyl-prolyl cis-trans isomerase [Candidatus Bathyarchaeia archaeon]